MRATLAAASGVSSRGITGRHRFIGQARRSGRKPACISDAMARASARAAGSWSGKARPVFRLPPALARLQAFFMELLPGTPLMSRDNLDSMRVANVASGSLPGLAALGITPTPLDAVAPLYLAGASVGRGRLNAYRAMARRG
jgi:hypothetical protein